MSATREINVGTKTLAKNMANRKQQNQSGYTLILGAGASISSGCPSFYTLCNEYCTEYSIKIENNDPITTVKKYFKDFALNSVDVYSWFSSRLKNHEPSIGYNHLINLIKQGYFTTIVTMNYDCLLENALINHMGLDDVKIMIRGELADDKISNLLKHNFSKVNIIKMHGDLLSGVFFITDTQISRISDELKRMLGNYLVKGCVIVGSDMNDMDLLRTLLDTNCESMTYVNPKDPSTDSSIMAKLQALTDKKLQIIAGDDGIFDTFFADLDMEIQMCRIESTCVKNKLKRIEQNIIEKQEKGSGYINYSIVTELVVAYVNKIKRHFNPDCLIFINDPAAAGGMELKRRLQKDFNDKKIGTILIDGEKESRQYKRAVRSIQSDLSIITDDVERILVLDAITFSGNTMIKALNQLNQWFPNKDIRPGVLILGETLNETITKTTEHPLAKIIYAKLTDRHEIFFPWGVTHATGTCNRSFRGIEEDNDYCIKIAPSPWGRIELLVDEKHCSVRILTIEAGQRYSLQRHLCRDEFFISLDDNIGIDICSDSLQKDEFAKYGSYSDVPHINSLVLEKGDYILIPRGLWHRFRANKDRVRLLEIGYGTYDENTDLDRREDKYERDKKCSKT